MRSIFAPVALLALAAACSEAPPPAAEDDPTAHEPMANEVAEVPAPPVDPEVPVTAWELRSGNGAAMLALTSDTGTPTATLICAASGGTDRLRINVPGFEPIGSEEQMNFGAGETVVALVADPGGDAQRGGVTGAGPLPSEFAAIVGNPEGIGIVYGAQQVGPLPAVPANLARTFVDACRE